MGCICIKKKPSIRDFETDNENISYNKKNSKKRKKSGKDRGSLNNDFGSISENGISEHRLVSEKFKTSSIHK